MAGGGVGEVEVGVEVEVEVEVGVEVGVEVVLGLGADSCARALAVASARVTASATYFARMTRQNMTMPLKKIWTMAPSSAEKRCPGRSMIGRWYGFGKPLMGCAPTPLEWHGPATAGSLRVIGLDDGADARDIAFDEDGRRAYVLSRRPESVLVVDLERADRQPGEAAILRVIEVGSGPSKIQVGELGVAPDARTFIFVSCFDTRDLYIIDAELGTLAAVVRGMSGPFEVAFDPVRQVLYVADFRASVVRVVDLSPLVLHDGRSVEVVGFLGHPRPVEMLR